jgi:hypothetical protein
MRWIGDAWAANLKGAVKWQIPTQVRTTTISPKVERVLPAATVTSALQAAMTNVAASQSLRAVVPAKMTLNTSTTVCREEGAAPGAPSFFMGS